MESVLRASPSYCVSLNLGGAEPQAEVLGGHGSAGPTLLHTRAANVFFR